MALRVPQGTLIPMYAVKWIGSFGARQLSEYAMPQGWILDARRPGYRGRFQSDALPVMDAANPP